MNFNPNFMREITRKEFDNYIGNGNNKITKQKTAPSEDINKEIQYLLNSHHELIIALKKNNAGLMEMNILLRGLIEYFCEDKDEQ